MASRSKVILSVGQSGRAKCVGFHPRKEWLAVLSAGGLFTLWNYRERAVVKSFACTSLDDGKAEVVELVFFDRHSVPVCREEMRPLIIFVSPLKLFLYDYTTDNIKYLPEKDIEGKSIRKVASATQVGPGTQVCAFSEHKFCVGLSDGSFKVIDSNELFSQHAGSVRVAQGYHTKPISWLVAYAQSADAQPRVISVSAQDGLMACWNPEVMGKNEVLVPSFKFRREKSPNEEMLCLNYDASSYRLLTLTASMISAWRDSAVWSTMTGTELKSIPNFQRFQEILFLTHFSFGAECYLAHSGRSELAIISSLSERVASYVPLKEISRQSEGPIVGLRSAGNYPSQFALLTHSELLVLDLDKFYSPCFAVHAAFQTKLSSLNVGLRRRPSSSSCAASRLCGTTSPASSIASCPRRATCSRTRSTCRSRAAGSASTSWRSSSTTSDPHADDRGAAPSQVEESRPRLRTGSRRAGLRGSQRLRPRPRAVLQGPVHLRSLGEAAGWKPAQPLFGRGSCRVRLPRQVGVPGKRGRASGALASLRRAVASRHRLAVLQGFSKGSKLVTNPQDFTSVADWRVCLYSKDELGRYTLLLHQTPTITTKLGGLFSLFSFVAYTKAHENHESLQIIGFEEDKPESSSGANASGSLSQVWAPEKIYCCDTLAVFAFDGYFVVYSAVEGQLVYLRSFPQTILAGYFWKELFFYLTRNDLYFLTLLANDEDPDREVGPPSAGDKPPSQGDKPAIHRIQPHARDSEGMASSVSESNPTRKSGEKSSIPNAGSPFPPPKAAKLPVESDPLEERESLEAEVCLLKLASKTKDIVGVLEEDWGASAGFDWEDKIVSLKDGQYQFGGIVNEHLVLINTQGQVELLALASFPFVQFCLYVSSSLLSEARVLFEQSSANLKQTMTRAQKAIEAFK